MATLLIDDMKNPDELGYEVDRIARDFPAALAALAEQHWDLVLLDHDLADFSGANGDERKGVHVVRWLSRPENRKHIPGAIICVSRNNVGGPSIEHEVGLLYEDPDMVVTLDTEYMKEYYRQLSGD